MSDEDNVVVVNLDEEFGDFDDADIAFLEQQEVKEEVEEEEELVVKKDKKGKKDKKEKKGKKEKKRKRAGDDMVQVKEEVDDVKSEIESADSEEKPKAKAKAKARKRKRKDTEEDSDQQIKEEIKDEFKDELKEEHDSDIESADPEPTGDPKVVAARELVLNSLRHGMPGKFFSTDEQEYFRITRNDIANRKHMYTRNMILREWDKDPSRRVYLSRVRKLIDNANIYQPHSVFSYCEDRGLVNYGALKEKWEPISNGKKVLVIGAGISGLMAAQQLRRAGFTVQVLEGSDDVGGRCKSAQMKGGFSVPIGPPNRYDIPDRMFNEDVEDDTRSVVSQGSVELVPVTGALDTLGTGDRAASITSQDPVPTEDKKSLERQPVEHQKAVLHNLLLQAGEKLTQEEGRDATFYIFGPDGGQMIDADAEVAEAEQKLQELLADIPLYDPSWKRDPSESSLKSLRTYVDSLSNKKLKHMCTSVLNTWEEQTHARIEELGRGSDLFRVYNAHIIDTPWHDVCTGLREGIEVKCNAPVTNIEYTENGVWVTTVGEPKDGAERSWEKEEADRLERKEESSEEESRKRRKYGRKKRRGRDESEERDVSAKENTRAVYYQYESDAVKNDKRELVRACDYCVVTVPVGVLKAKSLRFNPRLPEDKQAAIKCIGSGTKNTLVLEFDRPFWMEQKLIPEEGGEPQRVESMEFVMHKKADSALMGVGSRGSLQMTPKPHAILSLTGDAANCADEGVGTALVEEAMKQFKLMFSTVDVPDQPVSFKISKWGKDEFSKGSSPYVAAVTLPEHFSKLGEPCGRVHFAGDATDPELFGLLSGAAASGLRASREIIQSYKAMLSSGKIRRQIPTPRERLRELAMNGAASRVTTTAIVKREAPVQVRGASTNLAAKYAKTEALPTMQKNLFNARVKPNDENKARVGQSYLNVQVAKATAANQQSLAKLEKQTELRWQEAKLLRQRELAKDVAARQSTALANPKRDRPSTYMATNAVDDALPTWYYQQPKKVDERTKEFATSFYKGPQRKTKDDTEGSAKQRYLARLQGVIDRCMRKYAVPYVAKASGTEIKIYAKSTLDATRKALVGSIVTRFQKAHETKIGRTFAAADWSELPSLAQGSVIAALRVAIDKYFKNYIDPLKDATIAKLGYDPNFEKPPEPEQGARSEITAKTGASLATSFLAQPHGYEAAEHLPSAEYTPGFDEDGSILTTSNVKLI